MGEVTTAIKHSESQQYLVEDMQQETFQSNNEEAVHSESDQEFMLAGESTGSTEIAEVLEKDMQHGCPHYRRRCRIRAPCCNEIFDCRHCHNDAKNNINVDQKQRHDIPRHQVTQVICTMCGTEQEVRQVCVNCGVCMGKYFCETCKLFDDDTSKKQYHCNGCGICRYNSYAYRIITWSSLLFSECTVGKITVIIM